MELMNTKGSMSKEVSSGFSKILSRIALSRLLPKVSETTDRQLNVGNRETVLETVLLAGHEAGQFETVTHKITKLSDISRWHKATGNKVMLEQVSNPFGIFLVSFLSTDSLNIL